MKNTHATDRPPVLIVGGSLAGLLTAHTLAGAGIPSTVFERAGADRRSGAALAVDDRQLVDVLGYARATGMLGRSPRTGNTLLPATWAQLHSGLLAAAEAEPLITLRHNTSVTAVGQDAGGAWAILPDESRVTAATVIGADGYRSVVRPAVNPHRPDATFAGYTLWLGVADEANIPAPRAWPRSLDIRSAGGYYLLGYPLAGKDNTEVSGHRRLGWAWYDARRNDLLRSLGSVQGTTVKRSLRPEAIPKRVHDELAADARKYWPSPWRGAILDSITRKAVTCTPISEYLPDRLTRGRIALVGDAAHVPTPMTGMGFATAVDDAAALAAALSEATTRTIPEALNAYAMDRLAPARELVLSGQGFSRGFAA